MLTSKRSIVAVVVVLMILATVFAGCTGNNNVDTPSSVSNTPPAGDTPPAQDNTKLLKLDVSFMGIKDGFDAPGAKDDTIFNSVLERFNIEINPIQVTWNDWQDKAKVWAASNQLPDIFPNVIAVDNPAMYASWAKQGVIKALPDDLSKYPNIARIMELPSVQPLKVDGKFYTIPRMTYDDSSDWIMDRPILYRKDWAAQAGFTSEPESFEEYVAMIKAVMKQHPEIAGIALNHQGYLLTQFLGTTLPEMSHLKTWVKEDGKWMPVYTSTKAYEGIKQLRQLYTEGLLDKDFAIQKDKDGFTKFLNGQAFISYGGALTDAVNIDAFKKANPDVKLMDAIGFMNIWPAADGNRYTFVETPYWSEVFFSNKMDDEKFESALQLIDFMASEEFAALTKNGIEGVDYKIEGGKAISLLQGEETLNKKYPVTSAISVLGSWHGGFYKLGKTVIKSDPDQAAMEAYDQETFNKFKQENKPAPINFDIMLMSTPAKDKLGGISTDVQNNLINVILGKGDPIEMWKGFVKSYDAKGLQDAITEVNAKAQEMGIQ